MADDRDPIPIERDSVEYGRAIGFFDATFAIAATLLVTTLVLGAPSAARYFWLVLIPLGYFGGKWSSARIAALHQADEVSA